MDTQQNGHDAAIATQQPQSIREGVTVESQPVMTLNLPGIEVLLPSLSSLERGILETDLRTVIINWLRAKGIIKV